MTAPSAGVPATIPATLLLEERAEQAMNAVVGLADDDCDHVPFFSANLLSRPAYLRHGSYDYGSSHGRLVDASILARHMSGKSWWSQTEGRYKATLLDLLGRDGLAYRRPHARGSWEPNAHLIDQRAVLLALTSWYLDGGDPAVKRAADNQVAALRRIAIKVRDAWFYPSSEYTVNGWPSANSINHQLAPDPASFSGRLVMPLLRWHRASGNQDAIDLCGWFVRLIVDRSGVFNADGSFNDAKVFRDGHFHTRLGTLDGLARYAEFTGDHALTQFVERSFAWALTQATGFGWTPGDLTDQRYEHETCSLVDLIAIATTLARLGFTGYWAVAERFVRNHLAESQLHDLSWVESAPDRSQDEPGWITYYQVGERVRGAFAGYGAPNDFVSDVFLGRGHTADIQACCIGSGVRGLFTAWDSIVSGDEDLVRVNLLLNRGSRLVDVRSHLPHEGRVDLDVHADCRELRLRVPEWAGYTKLAVTRRSADGEVAAAGAVTAAGAVATAAGSDVGIWAPDGYLSLTRPRAGERITVTFPVAESTTVEVAAGREFRATWRGDDVVAISPQGTSRPMYSGRQVFPKAPERHHTLAVPAGDLPV